MTKKYRCIDDTGDFQKVLKKGVIYKGRQNETSKEYIDIEVDGKWKGGWFKSRFIEVKDDRKIVGYKCPQDLYSGYLKKGTVLEATEHFEYLYTGVGFDCYLPKELVESWEPVYEEEKFVKMEIGKPKVPITIHKNGKIEQSGKHPFITNVSEIRYLSSSLRASPKKFQTYPVTIRSVWIGCPEEGVEVTISELLDIEINYNKLTNK